MRIVHQHQPPAPSPAPQAPAEEHPPSKDEHTKAAHPMGSKIKEKMEQWGQVATPSFNEREQHLREEHEREVHPVSETVAEAAVVESGHAQEPEPTPTPLKDRIAKFREQSSPDAFEKKWQAEHQPEPEPEPEVVKEEEEVPQKVHPVSGVIKERMEQWGAVATLSFNEREYQLRQEQEQKLHPHDVLDTHEEAEPAKVADQEDDPPSPASLKDRIAMLHSPKSHSPRSPGKPADMPEVGNLLKDRMAKFGQLSPMPVLDVEEETKEEEPPKQVGVPKAYEKPADMPQLKVTFKDRLASFGDAEPSADAPNEVEADASDLASPKVEKKAYEKPSDMPTGVSLKNLMAAYTDVASPVAKSGNETDPANVSFEPAGVTAEVRQTPEKKGERPAEMGVKEMPVQEDTPGAGAPKAYERPSDMPSGVSLKNLKAAYTDKARRPSTDEDMVDTTEMLAMVTTKPTEQPRLDVQVGEDASGAGTPKAYERPADMPTGVSFKGLLSAYTDKARRPSDDEDEVEPASPVKVTFTEAVVADVDTEESPVMANEEPGMGTPKAYERPSDMPTGVSLKNLMAAYTDKAKPSAEIDDKAAPEKALPSTPKKEEAQQDSVPEVESDADESSPKIQPKGYERPADMPTGVSLKHLMAAYTDVAKKPAAQ
ncbi:hypothetical protein ACHAXT_007318 [Thalassiosira profunda]